MRSDREPKYFGLVKIVPQVPLDGKLLVRRKELFLEPYATLRTEQVGCRTGRTRCACRIDCTMFFRRVRWRTTGFAG